MMMHLLAEAGVRGQLLPGADAERRGLTFPRWSVGTMNKTITLGGFETITLGGFETRPYYTSQ